MAEENWWASAPLATLPKAAPAGRGRAGGGPSKTDQTALEAARAKALSAENTERLYNEYAPVVKRFDSGPDKASWIASSTPAADDGVFGSIYARTIGKAIRGVFIDDQDEADYARLKGLQVDRVKESHKDEKGVQTNQDDALEMLRDVGPDKTRSFNRDLIRQGRIKIAIAKREPQARSYWISKYGGTDRANPSGQTFDQFWGLQKGMIEDTMSGRPNQRLQNIAAQKARASAAKAKVAPTSTKGWTVQR